MSLAEIQNEHIRGALLGLLREGSRANCSVLTDAINSVKGVSASRDQVRSCLVWLGEQGLVRVEEINAELLAAVITTKGEDFELGRCVVPGIKRPRAR